ncbi:hypothetical protein DFJ63DRAFT_311339 [Scheffersomyces coipomensis]|uniref:uncharacterized protein n=1 Tax=Scheffersomyces coipomensis TaxID=1788519 RepID=UPI00315D3B03
MMYPHQSIYYHNQQPHPQHPSSVHHYHSHPHLSHIHTSAANNGGVVTSNGHNAPPLTPLDLTYSHSMIPSNLLVGSPYFAPSSPNPNGYFTHQQYHTQPQQSIYQNHQHTIQHNQYHEISPPIQSPLRSRGGSTTSLSSHFTRGSKNYSHNHHHHHHHQNQHQSPYLTHLNNSNSISSTSQTSYNRNLDNLNLSRTIILRNLSEDLSLNELLNEIEFGPIEYCKMFSKPTPESMLEKDSTLTKNLKVCYISFINSKISIMFHLKYHKNANSLKEFKSALKDSKYLRIQLNDSSSNSYPTSSNYSSTSLTQLASDGTASLSSHNPSVANQDYIKLKTLNYIIEFNASRCLVIKFSISLIHEDVINKSTEDRLRDLQLFINNQCSKFGDVEEFKISFIDDDEAAESNSANGQQHQQRQDIPAEVDNTDEDRTFGKVLVHFTSIDAAIKTYESYLRRIQHDIQRLINNKEGASKKRPSKDVNEVNSKYDIKFNQVYFHKDRCDRTEIESTPAQNGIKSKKSESDYGLPLTQQHIHEFNQIPEEDFINGEVDEQQLVQRNDLEGIEEDNDESDESPNDSGIVIEAGLDLMEHPELIDESELSPSISPPPVTNDVDGTKLNGEIIDGGNSFDSSSSNSGYPPTQLSYLSHNQQHPNGHIKYANSEMMSQSGLYHTNSHAIAIAQVQAQAQAQAQAVAIAAQNQLAVATAAAAAATAQANSVQMNPDSLNVGNRTIYLGNLHPNTTIEEIANNVRAGGLVESINYHPEKKVCFITFVDASVALKFYLNHQVLHQLIIHGYDITVGWAKQHSGPLSREIALAVTAGASRNVYIGIRVVKPNEDGFEEKPNKTEKVRLPNEELLRQDFSKFGELEQINFYHNKDCGFLNFLNILDAISLVEVFEITSSEVAMDRLGRLLKHCSKDEVEHLYYRYKPFKISFAKDRCGNHPKFSFKKKFGNELNGATTYQLYHQDQQYKQFSKAKNNKNRLVNGNVHHESVVENSEDVNGKVEAEEIVPKNVENEEVVESTEKSEEKKDFTGETISPEAAMVFGIISESEQAKSEAVNETEDRKTADVPPSVIDEDDEDDDEDEDDDDVSIIIGSDDTTSTTAHNSNDSKKVEAAPDTKNNKAKHSSGKKNYRYEKVYHSKFNISDSSIPLRRSSRNSSNVSLNTQYMKYQQQQQQQVQQSPYMQQQPMFYYQAATPVGPQSLSRVSSHSSFRGPQFVPATTFAVAHTPTSGYFTPQPMMAQPAYPAYYQYAQPPMQHISHQQNNSRTRNGKSISSGSQVMAQYLARAQNDNAYYGSNMLSNDVEYDEDYNDYESFPKNGSVVSLNSSYHGNGRKYKR